MFLSLLIQDTTQLGEPSKLIFGKSWEFGPKLNLLGFCRNMAGVPQSQPKNHQKCHQKSHKNHQSPKKMGLFHEKIICLE